jgi:phage/plasmid primase-like uncharacterized protein
MTYIPRQDDGPAAMERAKDALGYIDASDRDTWWRMAMALKSEFGEAGFAIWDDWSQTADNYNQHDAMTVWRGIKSGGGVGIGSLFHEAKETGWRDDVTYTAETMTPEQVEERRQARLKKTAEAEEQVRHEQAQAARWTAEIWQRAEPVVVNQYLDRKQVLPTSTLRQADVSAINDIIGYPLKSKGEPLTGVVLVAPMRRAGSSGLCSTEFIDGTGRKTALAGRGTKSGAYWATERLDDPAVLLVGEGVATVMSASQAVNLPGVAALSCGNMKAVALAMREMHPAAKIILLADLKKDTGAPDEKAVEAAKLVNGCLAVPDFKPGREPGQTDFNDLHVAKGLDAVRAIIEAAVSGQEASVWNSPADIAAMLATKPEPMPWLFTQRVPFGRGGGLAALGGTGKTSFLKTMGIGCITGRLPMDGWEVERTGKVVLVLTEDTHAEFHEDLHRLCYGMTTHERELIARNLIVYPLAGKDTRLLTKSPRGVVEKSALYQALVAKIQATGGVVLVGLDPALGITEGDEMNQADQRALGRAVDDLAVTVGATCILLTHSSKGLLNAEELGSHSSRGGGALTDALRFEITMRGMTAKEATAHGIEDLEERMSLVQVAITKGNRIPPAAKVPVWLKYDSGTLVSADLVEPEKKTKADGTKLPKSAALAFEVIKEATMEHGQVDDATGRPYVAMDDIRTTHKDLYTQRNPANGDRAERKALQDGTSKLVELGWIKSDGLTVTFSGPGMEAHVQNILAAMVERRGRNCGTERNFSELSSAKGTETAERNGTPPIYIGGSGSAKFRGEFDQKEVKPESSSPGTSQIVEGII